MTTKYKFPISATGKQCLGPCQKKGTFTIHPNTLAMITNMGEDFCPIKEEIVISLSGKQTKIIQDKCKFDHAAFGIDNITYMLAPSLLFSRNNFLSSIYSINSYSDSILWFAENKTSAIHTKRRIFDCVLSCYNQSIVLIDKQLVLYFIEYIKILRINDLYGELYQYIKVNDSEVFILLNAMKKEEFYIERINFIIQTFVNEHFIETFIRRYISLYKNAMNDDNTISNSMYIVFVKYIISKINKQEK